MVARPCCYTLVTESTIVFDCPQYLSVNEMHYLVKEAMRHDTMPAQSKSEFQDISVIMVACLSRADDNISNVVD
jgi:hypothetical protein